MTKKTSLTFSGDISFSAYLKDLYKKEKIFTKEVLDFSNNSDAFIMNYESPITNFDGIIQRKLSHKSNPAVIDVLKNNFTKPVLSIANNHMQDYNTIGFLDTLDNLKKANIPYMGAEVKKEDAIKFSVFGDDVKIAVISMQYKFLLSNRNTLFGTIDERDVKDIKKELNKIKNQVDWTVLIYHGGEEFIKVPFPDTRQKMINFLNLGFDIVVGHHPHIVQGYEKVGEKMIFYSLGNFLFDTGYQQQQKDTDKGMILKLDFEKDKYSFDKLFTKFDREKQEVIAIEDNIDFIEMDDKSFPRQFAKASLEYDEIQNNKTMFLNSGKKRSFLAKVKRALTRKDRVKRRLTVFRYSIKHKILYKEKE